MNPGHEHDHDHEHNHSHEHQVNDENQNSQLKTEQEETEILIEPNQDLQNENLEIPNEFENEEILVENDVIEGNKEFEQLPQQPVAISKNGTIDFDYNAPEIGLEIVDQDQNLDEKDDIDEEEYDDFEDGENDEEDERDEREEDDGVGNKLREINDEDKEFLEILENIPSQEIEDEIDGNKDFEEPGNLQNRFGWFYAFLFYKFRSKFIFKKTYLSLSISRTTPSNK